MWFDWGCATTLNVDGQDRKMSERAGIVDGWKAYLECPLPLKVPLVDLVTGVGSDL